MFVYCFFCLYGLYGLVVLSVNVLWFRENSNKYGLSSNPNPIEPKGFLKLLEVTLHTLNRDVINWQFFCLDQTHFRAYEQLQLKYRIEEKP